MSTQVQVYTEGLHCRTDERRQTGEDRCSPLCDWVLGCLIENAAWSKRDSIGAKYGSWEQKTMVT